MTSILSPRLYSHSGTRLRVAVSCSALRWLRFSSSSSNPSSALSDPSALVSLSTPSDRGSARAWIAHFLSLPPASCFHKDSLQITYSRSSGPGGQNVNKLSTKSTLRIPLQPWPSYLPPYLKPTLLSSPYYVTSPPPGLQVSSSVHRTQPQNLEEGLKRLKSIVLEAAAHGLVGETTEEQKERVEGLKRKETHKMIKVKKGRKEVKGGRRSKGVVWD